MSDQIISIVDLEVTGFTGTRDGMTADQVLGVRRLLEGSKWLAVGDCEGADEQAHYLATKMGIKTWGFPPINKRYRAYLKYDKIEEPEEYLPRNDNIVRVSDRLVATPKGYKEEKRSGTWYTIRQAVKTQVPVLIVWPNGYVTDETIRMVNP